MKCTNNVFYTINDTDPIIDIMYYSPFAKSSQIQFDFDAFSKASKQIGHIPIALANDKTVKYNMTLKELQQYKEWVEHIIKCYEDGKYDDI